MTNAHGNSESKQSAASKTVRENNYGDADYNDNEYSQERFMDSQRLKVKGSQFQTIDVRETR